MPDGLRPYFDHVWPLFWPWLIWNLVRFARWHERTGLNALLSVDCFGNIRIVQMCDAPPADDLYVYDAPAVARWAMAALASALPEGLGAPLPPLRRDPEPYRSLAVGFSGASGQARAPPWVPNSPQTPAHAGIHLLKLPHADGAIAGDGPLPSQGSAGNT
ncbi:MAG: hypothetical protein R3C04_11675 [Hyphomonas sp.]